MFSNELWQKSGVSTYSIDQSIRFNALDNPYMSKAFSSKGSPKKFTLSWWTKLGERTTSATSESQMFFIAYHSSGYQTDFSIQSAARAGGVAHTFRTYSVTTSGGAVWNFTTTQVFRDPSAWYNFCVVSDTDNATQTERFKLYINGQRVTDFSTATYPSSGVEPVWNNSTSVTHYVGSRAGNANTRFDGYMAEMVHIDGQALTPSSFGETNDSGIWIPKDVSNLTFGTNGFHIDGRDSSDLGDDESGQGNDFTTSGLAAHDQVADSPSNNFCTLNPIYRGTGSQYGVQENGNLELKYSGAQNAGQVCTQLFTTGKWYWEMRIKAGGGSPSYFLSSGIAAVNDGYVKSDANMHGTVTGEIGVNSYNGELKFSGSLTKTYTEVPFADGDILQVAVDTDNGAIYYGKNGTFMGSGDPTSGASKTNAGATWTPASYSGGWVPTAGALGGSAPIVTMNFGQEGTFSGGTTAGGNSDGNEVGNFKYSVPSGYLALCTKNLGS
jgi:hypothetical protein